MSQYRKFLVALVGALAVVGAEIPADAPGWLTGAFAVISAIGVYAVRNDPPAKHGPPEKFGRQAGVGGFEPPDQPPA
jgi:hypothetical protein